MRSDVLALTTDALAALANRGLVKRAAREIEAAPPTVSEEPDGTLRGAFPDGAAPVLPKGGLDRATCTCGAAGTCRHVIGLILAYQMMDAEPEKPDFVEWSPGAFTDEDLAARIGARMMAAARKARRAGYLARVRRPSPSDPAPRVDLGSATVRFLVPHDLGFVHTDAATGVRDDVIALAVWAFRAADEQFPGEPETTIGVGVDDAASPTPAAGAPSDGASAAAGSDAAEADSAEALGASGAGGGGGTVAAGLAAAVGLADDVLLGGAVHAGAGMAAVVADVRRRLERAGARWALAAVGELAEQLVAYRERASAYAPDRLAGLVAEVHARARAVEGRGGGVRARVLGTEEAAETPMRRARLDGLGCRVVGAGGEADGDERRIVEVFLAYGDTATVLVLRRSWDGDEPGERLARRRVGGATVAQLAAGNLVTESAVRSASRAVRLATGRIAKATVTPSRGAWAGLPGVLLVRDLRALTDELDRLPPRVVRPRVEAELVRVVEVAGVGHVAYSPGAQRLTATVTDAAGEAATITATHTAAAPGRLDAVAAALAQIAAATATTAPADAGPSARTGSAVEHDAADGTDRAAPGPDGGLSADGGVDGAAVQDADAGTGPADVEGRGCFVSGVVRRAGGGIEIEPLAFAVGGRVIVPDLAEAGGGGLGPRWVEPGDPMQVAVEHAVAVLAEVPHRGLRHLPPGFGERVRAAGDELLKVGLHRAAEAVGRFRDAVGPEPGEAAVQAWVDAHLRLMITADLL